MNHLLADDSHEISSLICFKEQQQCLKILSTANYSWRFMAKVIMLKTSIIDLTMVKCCGRLHNGSQDDNTIEPLSPGRQKFKVPEKLVMWKKIPCH